jgi:hypothetical protein
MTPIRQVRGLAIIGVLMAAVMAKLNPAGFWQSYLLGYLFWTGIALGSLGLLLLFHLTGGKWGKAILPILESSASTLPWWGLMLLPVLFRLQHIYPWARPELVAADPLLQHKHLYLNVPFFLARSVFYFTLWGWLAARLVAWKTKTADQIQATASLGLLAFVVTSTFAAFDWSMSLDPHWGSSIYGVMFVVGNTLSALAFSVVVLSSSPAVTGGADLPSNSSSTAPSRQLNSTGGRDGGSMRHDGPPTGALGGDVAAASHDLGNLLLAFTMLWAYIQLSQYLIIWYGNLPEEITWYAIRGRGSWGLIAGFLVFAQFLLPFLLLLARRNKRNLGTLAKVAAWILAVRLVDLFWVVVPTFHALGISVGLEDLVVPAALGGLWLTLFFDQYERRY